MLGQCAQCHRHKHQPVTRREDNVADHPTTIPRLGQVVIELINSVENQGHCTFADNWYTSPALVHRLTQQGFAFCRNA